MSLRLQLYSSFSFYVEVRQTGLVYCVVLLSSALIVVLGCTEKKTGIMTGIHLVSYMWPRPD